MELNNAVAIITGAGSGIGREICLELARRKTTIIAVDYNSESLQETLALARAEHFELTPYVLDISNREAVQKFVDHTKENYSAINLLINNAGIVHPFASIEKTPLSHIERVFNVNWWGQVYLIKGFFPQLRMANEAMIVNLSSMGGLSPFPGQGGYGASKAAIKLFSETLAVELASSSIRVMAVYPGAVKTNITDNSPDMSDKHRSKIKTMETKTTSVGVTPQVAAHKIAEGIARNKLRVLIGYDSIIIDKLYRLMPILSPRVINFLIDKFVPDLIER